MRRRLLQLLPSLLFSAAASASAFAAVGVAWHGAASPWTAAAFYAPFGAISGLLCSALQLAWRRLPVQDMPLDGSGHGETPAAALARSVLAQMAAATPAQAPRAEAAAPAAAAPSRPAPADQETTA